MQFPKACLNENQSEEPIKNCFTNKTKSIVAPRMWQPPLLKTQSLDLNDHSPLQNINQNIIFQLPEIIEGQCSVIDAAVIDQKLPHQSYSMNACDSELSAADNEPSCRGILKSTVTSKLNSSMESRPIYPNVPYSPYGSPSNRRRAPLRESRRISIERSGSFLQLNQYKLMDQIGQVRLTTLFLRNKEF